MDLRFVEDNKALFYKNVFALVLPMALQNLINVGVTSADVIMLGKVGEIALSASSLAGQIYFILSLILFGLTSGAAVITAQYWGKNIGYFHADWCVSWRVVFCGLPIGTRGIDEDFYI